MTSRPRSERQATPPSERPPTFSGFVVRLLVYLFLASLLFSLGGLHERMGPIQEGMARLVGAGGNLLGADATVDGTIIKSPHAALEINHECTGVFVLLVYGMFVLAYPAPWVHRCSGIAIGWTALTVINVARLMVLTMIASKYPDWFAYFHEYFFQGLFIALLAVLASIWTEQVRRATVGRVSA
jgi:archaeosortase B (VPXXXP-CTERM-specific)